MVEIGKAKKLKVMSLLLFLCLFLVACGNPKLGDMFILKRTALGGMNIHSMEKTFDEMEELEEMGGPDAVAENLDNSEVASLSLGTLVRVTDISDKHRMVQIQSVNPKTGDRLKMWVNREELKRDQQL